MHYRIGRIKRLCNEMEYLASIRHDWLHGFVISKSIFIWQSDKEKIHQRWVTVVLSSWSFLDEPFLNFLPGRGSRCSMELCIVSLDSSGPIINARGENWRRRTSCESGHELGTVGNQLWSWENISGSTGSLNGGYSTRQGGRTEYCKWKKSQEIIENLHAGIEMSRSLFS